MCILLDKDIILANVKMNYNGSICQKSHVKDSKYIFKEYKTLLFRLTDRRVSLRIMKNKNHVRTRIQTHICNHTHTCKHTKTTHAFKDTRMHANVCSPAHTHTHTHTHKVFFGDRSPEFVEPLAAHCLGGWIQFFKQILKTVVFSQSFEIPACF